MSTVVALLKDSAERVKQYDATDLRAHQILTARILTTAPEGFFVQFDKAVQQGVQRVQQAKPRSQQAALTAVLEYAASLNTSETSQQVVVSLMLNELFGHDVLDPLIRDRSTHEVSVTTNGEVSITVHGAERPVPSVRFRSRQQLSSVVNKMLKNAVQKKRVSQNAIRATLKTGAVITLTQNNGELSLQYEKAKRAPVAEPAPEATESPHQRPASNRSDKPSSARKRSAERRPDPRSDDVEIDENGSEWRTDPKTGKRYKVMQGVDPEFLRAAKRQGATELGFDDLMDQVKLDPDFDGDDLNSSAEIFMAHLRVAPDKKEQQQLREERSARIRKLRQERPEEWGTVTE